MDTPWDPEYLDECCPEQDLGDNEEHLGDRARRTPRQSSTMPDVEPYAQIISSMALKPSLITPATHSSVITF